MSRYAALSSRRLLLAGLLALAVVAVAVPLASELLDILGAGSRRPVTLAGGVLWALALVGLVVGLLVALLAWPGRAARRGVVLGAGLAVMVVGSALAWQVASAPPATVPTCLERPTVAGLAAVSADTYVDGQQRDGIRGRFIGPAGGGLARLFDDLPRGAAEDLGVEQITVGDISRLARHCRALVSGSQVTAAVPEVTGDRLTGAPLVPAELPIWRGDFDWWVSAEGELVRARFNVGGHPADAWPVAGLRGQLLVELWPWWMISQ